MDTLLPDRTDAVLHFEVTRFLHAEAHLLDQRRWREWDGLFTADGRYWMPLSHDQTDPLNHASLFYEDAILRDVRIRRLEEVNAWSQQPPTRASRIVGNVQIEEFDGAVAVVRSAFQLTEWRKRRDIRTVAGHYLHRLVRDGQGWQMALKRVDLVNCDGIQDPFELFV